MEKLSEIVYIINNNQFCHMTISLFKQIITREGEGLVGRKRKLISVHPYRTCGFSGSFWTWKRMVFSHSVLAVQLK